MTYRVAAGVFIKRDGRAYADGSTIADGDLPTKELKELEKSGFIVDVVGKKKSFKVDEIEAER